MSTPKDEAAPTLLPIRQRLLEIKELRHDQLIDDDIALEYQRRLLDKLIGPGGAGIGA